MVADYCFIHDYLNLIRTRMVLCMSRIGSVSPQSASQKTEENVKSLLFHTLRSKPAEKIIHTIPRPSSSDVKTLLGWG